MAKSTKVTVTIVDVNGSFARLIREAPKEARAFLSEAVAASTLSIKMRMSALVPVDQGELKAALDTQPPKRNRLMGMAGVFDAEQAGIALYNEYNPNQQPFMVPAAQAEAEEFRQRCIRALNRLERAMAI